MQIYLPYKRYSKCVDVLDKDTLVRQQENVSKMIKFSLIKLGISKLDPTLSDEYQKVQTNPFFLLWWNNGKPYLLAMLAYLNSCNMEMFNRGFGFKHNPYTDLVKSIDPDLYNHTRPQTPTRITRGYRIILLCVSEEYYSRYFYFTLSRNRKLIKELKVSTEKFKFAKLLKIFR
jgi:hypothetical protein